jgi:hypothetical protein
VTPEAGAVADGQEDGLVLRARLGERLGSPGVPIDGIVRVEQEVGIVRVD